jgi:D-psicose/D-tagatose/L-ribulose 3-epimerase
MLDVRKPTFRQIVVSTSGAQTSHDGTKPEQGTTMKYGVNLLLFGDTITAEIRQEFSRLKDMGFDGVEVPVFDPDRLPAEEIRRAAEDAALELTASGALPPAARFYGDDPEALRRGEGYLRGCIRALSALGAPLICGPLYKAVGDTDATLPLDSQREQTVRALEPLVAEAEEAGVVFAFEPLNRFETNFINTVAAGIEFCRALDSPAAGLLLDTFHMHIEEKDSAGAIRRAAEAGVLAHFHAAENDRGVLGTGQVHWAQVGETIRSADYDSWCVMESFSQSVREIRRAVSCWRPFYPSTDAFCRDSLLFMKNLIDP